MKHYVEHIPGPLFEKLKGAGYRREELPTYAEVLDWLLEREIYIDLLPGFTYATINHFGFSYVIHYINMEAGKMEKVEWNDFASFTLALDFAIEDALCRFLYPGQNQS